MRVFPGLDPVVTDLNRRSHRRVRRGRSGCAPVIFGENLDNLDDDRRSGRAHTELGLLRRWSRSRTKPPRSRRWCGSTSISNDSLSTACLPPDVLDTLQAAFAGESVGKIYIGDRAVDLAVSAQQSLRQDPEGVGDLLLRSTSGISVPLKAVANVYLTDDRAIHLSRWRLSAAVSSPLIQREIPRNMS